LFTAPEAPVNLQAVEKTAHDMNLTWEHPRILNGYLRKFEVQVKLISSKLWKQEGEMKMFVKNIEVKTLSKIYSCKVSEF
jgi:hypothetical protein